MREDEDSGEGDDMGGFGDDFNEGPDSEGVEGVEIVTLADELGHGVYLTCGAETTPEALVEGLCSLLAQVTRAAITRPQVKRAADLGLGDDVF